MDIREVVRLVRAGESNSGIARALRLNRRTVIRYRAWATEQGLLEGGLPSTGELQRLVTETLPASQLPESYPAGPTHPETGATAPRSVRPTA